MAYLFQRTVYDLAGQILCLGPCLLGLIRICWLLISGSLLHPKLSFLALAYRVIPEISPDHRTRKFRGSSSRPNGL